MNDCVATIHSSDRRSNREANRVETSALMPLRAAFGAVWLLALVFAVGARAVTEIDCELSGHVNVESRWFPEAGAHLGQRSHASGFVAASKLYLEDAAGRSLTLAPFFRYDNADPREAYLLLFGEIGDGEWELRVGVDQVFWGVTESQHLVDIVNQVDFVEHPAGEAKLGQPKVHFTWSSDWGVMEILGLPYHRARTFPGRAGRRSQPVRPGRGLRCVRFWRRVHLLFCI